MSQAPTSPPPVHAYSLGTALAAMTVCAVLAYALYWFYQALNETTGPQGATNTAPAQPEERAAELEQVINNAREERRTLIQADAQQRIAAARSLARITRLHADGDVIRRNLANLKARCAKWSDTVTALMANDSGRRIAASPSQLELFVDLQRYQQPAAEQLASWEAQLELLLKDVDRAYVEKDADVQLDDDYAAEVGQIGQEVKTALDRLAQQQGALEAMLQEVSGVKVPSDSPNLQEAIRVAVGRRAKEREALLAAELGKFREEADRRFAAERIENERLELEARIENERKLRDARVRAGQVAAETEAKKATDEAEQRRQRDEQRLAEREAERQREARERNFQAALPQIRQYLSTFLASGNTQPNAIGQFQASSKEGPVSLKAIMATGALNDNVEGLAKLNYMGFKNTGDRPAGGFPYYIGGRLPAENIPFTRTAQQLLIKYGDLLVEKKMLAP